MSYEGWIIATGILVGVTCGIVGSFLILRQIAMLSDAISHTVLLGIVLAFLISQSVNGMYMLIGAVIVGLLTAFLVQLLHQLGTMQDAAIGVVFTTLFAIGVILLSLFVENVHLDVEHALMGEITFVPWDTIQVPFLGDVPQAVVLLSSVLFIDLLIIFCFYKEFKITSFDPNMAVAIGIPLMFIHYLLMGMVSITTVAAFDSVGSILVVAMLIAPGATAYLLTDKLSVMLVFSACIGTIDALLGYYVASYFDVSISGAMASMAGFIFLLAWLFSPKYGLVSKKIAHLFLSKN
ncbi:metal ABC transporter permease [Massilibacterium senegalense]|uniref:metal ABC transporter permease n=1 Tax=Massilibacterium senegalense TaxID=1632858 RepID=UPI0007802EF1|nr:metal ABC transporter permease [Massilibacterium senegalense]